MTDKPAIEIYSGNELSEEEMVLIKKAKKLRNKLIIDKTIDPGFPLWMLLPQTTAAFSTLKKAETKLEIDLLTKYESAFKSV